MNRPPIVTILGHVDHGKTTLLDTIRKSRLTAKEAGGITQRIGGYEIDTQIKGYETSKITFIDTPGHEAFAQLRSRGAQVADIAILVIDANDSLKPQSIESIAHIKEAGIPFIVAINKIDLPTAKPDKVKRDLLKHEVVVEDMGGTVVSLPISATAGTGIPELLESILLIASDLKLSYETTDPVQAYIIESKKDQRGVVASVVIRNGKMSVGDTVHTTTGTVRIRSLINDNGKVVREVLPSSPFEMLGFSELPEVGTFLTSKPQEQKEEEVVEVATSNKDADFEAFMNPVQEVKTLSVVLKADAQGSLEAIVAALAKNENIRLILSGVGGINRSDIFLAKTTKSIVIGFSVAPDSEVRDLAKQEKVIIKTYHIIYELLDELEEVSTLLQEKEQQEKNLKAQAKILATFVMDGETAFGAKVTKGKINLGDPAEVYRGENLIGKTRLASLKIRAKSVQEVKKDQECGMVFSPILDIQVGDVVKYIL